MKQAKISQQAQTRKRSENEKFILAALLFIGNRFEKEFSCAPASCCDDKKMRGKANISWLITQKHRSVWLGARGKTLDISIAHPVS